MKRYCLFGWLPLAMMLWFAAMAAAAASAEVLDRIVAVVNEDVILLSELNARLAPYVQRIQQQAFDAEKERQMIYKVREDMLNRLVDEKLTDQEIARNDIKVNDTEIDSTIERIKAANYFTDEDLHRFLEKEGKTMEEYRNSLREQLLRTRLVNYQVKSKIVVTDEEIRAYYDSHPDIYGGKRRYHLRNLLLRVPQDATAAEREAVAASMEALRSQVQAGADFTELARIHSQGPAAASGGDIGDFFEETLSPQIQAALKGLEPGQATAVLETDHGFQMFYLVSTDHVAGKPLESVREDIHQKLYNEVVDQRFLSWLEKLRSQSHIKIIN